MPYSIELLSGSTNGRPISVLGTSSLSATTIHTATAGAGDIDLLTLTAKNQDTVSRTLVLAWGGTTDPTDLISVPIPPKQGFVWICERLPLAGGLVVVAWADVANIVAVAGSVTRVDK